MTPAELPAYLRGLRDRAAYAVIPAANAMAESFQREVVGDLTDRQHPRPTRTPSAPGEAPAMESGTLARSVAMVPATTPVVARSSCGPHVSPRDWVQEYGLTIHAKTSHGMRFTYGSDHYRAQMVTLPERSYVRSTVARMLASGEFTREAAAAFYDAMWG